MDEGLVGGMLGRYRIEGLLGRGGMATVYRALDPVFDRTVAIKVLSPQLARESQFTERFQREARSMARLQHPHILPVYDVGEQSGSVFLVMQYVEGGNLHEQLGTQRRAGELYPERVLGVLEAVASALDYAHSRGIVHRDVKPQNILLTERGYPYLTDFGIAKVLNGEQSVVAISHANAIIGTPEYMSPEQAQGQPLDGRADLYSLGVILYELFTGRTPFRVESAEDTPITILIRHAGTPPPAPSTLNPALGPAIEAVLLRALAKRADDRYPDGAALFAALRAALTAPGQRPTLLALPVVTSALTPLPVLPDLTPLPDRGMPGDTSSAQVLPPADVPVTGAARGRSRRFLAVLAGGAVILALVGILGARAVSSPGAGVVATSVPGTTIPAATAIVAAGAGVTATVEPPAPTMMNGPTASPLVVVAVPTRPVAVSGSAATPAAPARREVIFFAAHRNDVHDSQIYVMNPDGSGQRQLTFTRGHSWGPRASPDGRYIVFSSVAPGEHIDHSATGGGRRGEGHHEVFRANADGSGIVRLTATNAWNNAWAWAPDGQSLVIASDRDGGWELYRMSVKGEQDRIVRITTHPALDGWPSFTPDGRQLVFSSDRAGGLSQIYIMDADGGNVRRLNYSESVDTLPSVSPDGRRIAYAVQTGSDRTGITSDIYVMDIDGANATRLTRDSIAVNTDPSWSPDGTRIIFSSDREGNSNIYAMNADGSGVTRLTNDPGEDVTPFWATIQVGVGGVGETSGRVTSPHAAAPFALASLSLHRPTGRPARSSTAVTLPSSRSVRPSYKRRRRP